MMDPHEFARQQGQVAGQQAAGADAEPTDVLDLMDLLLCAYAKAGHLTEVTDAQHEAVGRFAAFGNEYLARRRVVSTGVVDGEFSLVFDDGQAVPLASTEPVPPRPDSTIPITIPREHKMKGMNVVDSSVPMTTGNVGSPVRGSRPRG